MSTTSSSHIIDPERLGLWVAAAFIIALLGFVLGVVALKRIGELTVISQVEVLALNKRIATLEKSGMPKADVAKPKEAAPPAKPAK